jgi:hypothetical protein
LFLTSQVNSAHLLINDRQNKVSTLISDGPLSFDASIG